MVQRRTAPRSTLSLMQRPLGVVGLALSVLLACSLGLSAGEQAEMDELVGTLTYAGALERWGMPLSKEEKDGHMIVVWKEARTEYTDVGGRDVRLCGEFTDAACIPHPGSAPGSVAVEHGYERTLVFDVKTRVLQTWNYRAW